MLKRNEEALKKIRIELKTSRKVNYKGFLIISCLDNFGETYYTMVNVKTQNHVHARTLPLAMKICDVSRFMFCNPGVKMKGYGHDILARASKLAFREVRRYQ